MFDAALVHLPVGVQQRPLRRRWRDIVDPSRTLLGLANGFYGEER